MPFHNVGPLKYYSFSSFEDQGLYHAIFTRRGGFSPSPWHSLNFGASVGDVLTRVARNRITALDSLNLQPDSVFDVYQVHSTDVIVTDEAISPDEPHQKADAIITNQPKVTLMMRFADCVPILLFDPVKRVIGIVHSGWIGTVGKIAKNAIVIMVDRYDSSPEDIIAGIGPSIGPDHYLIRKDVEDRVYRSFGDKADLFINRNDGRSSFDLWNANKFILMDAGLRKIEIAEICTCCNLDDWYSHRGERGMTGRFGAILGLYP